MYTDPISDMLTRIRNAVGARKLELALPYSKFKFNLATVLHKEGFIGGVNVINGKKQLLQLNLKYDGSTPVINGVKRVSSPGQRIYMGAVNLPRTNSGLGITVVSTSKGLMTDRQARREKVGGEIICQVW